MNSNKKPSLGSIFAEIQAKYENDQEQEPLTYSKEELINEINRLNEFNTYLHEACSRINEVMPTVIKNSKYASHHLMTEIGGKESFAQGIVKENAKELDQLSEKLSGVYEQIREPLLKMASLTEDIGTKLNRYYDIR